MTASLRRPMGMVIAFAMLAVVMLQLTLHADPPCGNGTEAMSNKDYYFKYDNIPREKTDGCPYQLVQTQVTRNVITSCATRPNNDSGVDCKNSCQWSSRDPLLRCSLGNDPNIPGQQCGDAFAYYCTPGAPMVITPVPVLDVCGLKTDCIWQSLGGSNGTCEASATTNEIKIRIKGNICVPMITCDN